MKSVNEAYLALIVGTSLLRNAINSKSLRDETKDILTSSPPFGEGSPRSRGLRPFNGRYSIMIHYER
jgi:hypothetical protein